MGLAQPTILEGLFRDRSFRPECSDVHYELPTLSFGKSTERRHTFSRISAGNPPEERAIAFLLYCFGTEIGSTILLRMRLVPVTASAHAGEQLASAGG